MLSFFKSVQEAGATESFLLTAFLANGAVEPHCSSKRKALVSQGTFDPIPFSRAFPLLVVSIPTSFYVERSLGEIDFQGLI